jgi:hypothetical protein
MDSAIGRIRSGRPPVAAIVLAGALVLVFAAWALSARTGSGSTSVTTSPAGVLGYLHGYAPTAAQVEQAFADHGVRLYRDDAAVLQPRFAPIRRYIVRMWRPAGAAHMLIVLLSRQPDRAVERLNSSFAPPGVVGSESSGRMWVEYGSLRPGFAARVRAAFGELRRLAPRA